MLQVTVQHAMNIGTYFEWSLMVVLNVDNRERVRAWVAHAR